MQDPRLEKLARNIVRYACDVQPGENVLIENTGFERAFGRRADKKRRLYNGRLECDFFAHRGELTAQAEQIVFTGAIDEFYQYRFGKLEYRTVHFEPEVKDCCN